MMTWVIPYLSAKWEGGARGPDRFDCWGLVMDISAKQFGTPLPDFDTAGKVAALRELTKQRKLSGDWEVLKAPVDGCIVAMGGSGKPFVPHHVGIYCCGHVVHCSVQRNVTCDTLTKLKTYGFTNTSFHLYRNRGNQPG